MYDFDKSVKKVKTELEAEIEPFLKKILITPQKHLTQFKEDCEAFYSKRDTSLVIMGLVEEIDLKALDVSTKEQIFALFYYVGLVETIGDCCVNILVMLLAAAGRDFEIRKKHMQSIKDLEDPKVSLGAKLDFLKDNKVEIPKKSINKDLRNWIAHADFKIKDKNVRFNNNSEKTAGDVIAKDCTEIIEMGYVVSNLIDDLTTKLGWT
jgi:hypothetical protein